ncbi:MAG: HEAT repeat domain-containing protein, partial [Polyangiaceae bacterium]|nr:HEAT repeat domain-containing protein [Polyangiaceae bacterium]
PSEQRRDPLAQDATHQDAIHRDATHQAPPDQLKDLPPDSGWDGLLEASPKAEKVNYHEVISRLLAGEENALLELQRGGAAAVGALMLAFPGPPLRSSNPRSSNPRSSAPLNENNPQELERPILKGLITMGSIATPFVTIRTADSDPNIRRLATLVLGELKGKDAARAIARRIYDEDPHVCRAALESARRLFDHALSRQAFRAQLQEVIADQAQEFDDRLAAIDALATIREEKSIPTLLRQLESPEGLLSSAALRALELLTAEDYGHDLDRWREFWQQHRDSPRKDWLFEALGHATLKTRQFAASELQFLGFDLGDYSADAPESTRSTALDAFLARQSQ